ncbi:PHB depolymerase family esterase [Nonomuraea sp. NEAU-A123]|uniref:extracellular catalytic domain type 1 short-chain-length polyhydroxyalkanoate depolymerase n=1 Tax=Nonomuraea sp. NEAU-A123 TaxID=2839649 RepID=UPI001BE3E511|nr:PHB depolymerase family esterase [Nonomuraea sp. NEAU-A123]MBT2232221.1 PHB depolymerase family esterase [Nonomuraea sp. NEAU-A123]
MRITTRVLGASIAAAMFIIAWLTMASPASPASLTEVTNFGTNPSGLRMHLYVPNNVAARPPILVAVHYCTGSGPAFYSGTEFASLADRYGFIVIYPSATRSGACFDVSSPQALKHDGGSDPVGIVSMVKYVEQHNNGDPAQVYVTGASSGGMMTNVLLGDYPDVFKAGAAFMGVPFGCFATTDGSGWNSACANGTIIKTPQEWGDLVRGAFPGYTGARPRMQLWHGTEDATLRYPNFQEEIKQWTNVHGLSQTPTFTDHPQSTWTRTRYGGTGTNVAVEGVSLQGIGHSLPQGGMAASVIQFFGLDSGSPGSPAPTPTPTPTPGGACRVTYTMNTWNTGFTAAVTITNTSASPINTWALTFTLPSGQTVTSAWNATISPTSGQVTARNVSYNGTIAAGASTNFGFQATHSGNTGKPTAFTLGGTTCTIA